MPIRDPTYHSSTPPSCDQEVARLTAHHPKPDSSCDSTSNDEKNHAESGCSVYRYLRWMFSRMFAIGGVHGLSREVRPLGSSQQIGVISQQRNKILVFGKTELNSASSRSQ